MVAEFTGNVIIDVQEKSERNLKLFRAAMLRLNPDAGFVEKSLGNHRGDFALEVDYSDAFAQNVKTDHPDIRVETKWLSERGPTDLFSSCSSGYERLKKEFKFLGSIKAPLFLAQGKDSDFAEYTTPGGVTWAKTLNTLFSLNARFRVPVLWADDAPEFLAMFLRIAAMELSVEGSCPPDYPRTHMVIDDMDLFLALVGHDDEYGTQFFCSFKCPGNHGLISEMIQTRGYGFWFFDDQDPAEMRDQWLVHEKKAVAIRASGGFTKEPEGYSGAIRTFGPSKTQYLPRSRKTRQKRKACVAFDHAGENPVFMVFNPPKKTGCEVEILQPKRINGDPVNPSAITGMKDLAPHSMLPLGKVKDRSKDETEIIPEILKFLNNHWAKGEQNPKIEEGEEVVESVEEEKLPDLVNDDINKTLELERMGIDIAKEETKEEPKGEWPYGCSNEGLKEFLDGIGKPEEPEAPYPPLYEEKHPVESKQLDEWQAIILARVTIIKDRIDKITKIQQLIRTEINNMANLPAPIKEESAMLNAASPGEVEKALLEVCGLGKASPAMQIVALKMANRYGFSLELKHVIPVKGNLYITRDGLLHIAHKSGKLDGIKVVDQGKDPKGGWWATMAVYRKDMSHPFEYTGRYNGPNKTFGPEMAIKCAESMCLRRAFDVSICSKEERWDVEEVKDARVGIPTATYTAPSNVEIEIVASAAEVLDAKPAPASPDPAVDYGMTYDKPIEKKAPPTPSSSVADVSKLCIVKTLRDCNIPLEHDFGDGTPPVKIMEATAYLYGAESWDAWSPDMSQRVDAIQFLTFFGWVIKKINFDAAFSLVEQGKVPSETGPSFMEDFLKDYDEKPESDVDAKYDAICKALAVVNVPF